METQNELAKVAEMALNNLKKHDSLVQVSKTTSQEFNIEANKLTLLRTNFDQSVSAKTIIDGRVGSGAGNQFSSQSLNDLTRTVTETAQASPADPAQGIAPGVSERLFFVNGPEESNSNWMHEQLVDLVSDVKTKFPHTIIEGGILKFVKQESVLATSKGSWFESKEGLYEGFAMFTTKEGKKSSSFNYTSFQLEESKSRLSQLAGFDELLVQSNLHLHPQKISTPFLGEIIITPHCMQSIVGLWLSYLSSGKMLKGTSFFNGKKDKAIGSSKLTIQSMPRNEKFFSQNFWTGDGYLTQNENIIEAGVLKNYLLSHYAAAKLNESVSRSLGSHVSVKAGDESLKSLIQNTKKGILLCRLSAGNPAENGDFSGIAKNSFYIENGEIQFPLSETMIAANLQKMLMNILGISAEKINFGSSEFPWMKVGGISVS